MRIGFSFILNGCILTPPPVTTIVFNIEDPDPEDGVYWRLGNI